ncbi:MAG TPA: polysaccharide deacetylase family protein [Rhodocyclaceae bacterium]|nr:polysaccharide deacetylase family protein [Rhodocyclaceae bacterium]
MRPLLSLLSPAGARGRLSILIWHRVLPAQDAIFPEEMHAARFDATLGWIKRAFNVLPLHAAAAQLKTGTLPARALAITFDDGYEDNHSVALPLLRKHGLTATFFIATSFIDGGRMWNDTVIETVRRASVGAFDAGEFGRYELGDANTRRAAIDSLIGKIKYLGFDARRAAVDALAARAGVTLPHDLMMSADQVRDLKAAGMTIGAHTRSHPILAKIAQEDALAEIAQGRAELEEMIGERVTLFAYPNGRPDQDYRSEHVVMVREMGFDAAVSTTWGASRHGDDPFQLRRFSPWDTSRGKFLTRMGFNQLRSPAKIPLA